MKSNKNRNEVETREVCCTCGGVNSSMNGMCMHGDCDGVVFKKDTSMKSNEEKWREEFEVIICEEFGRDGFLPIHPITGLYNRGFIQERYDLYLKARRKAQEEIETARSIRRQREARNEYLEADLKKYKNEVTRLVDAIEKIASETRSCKKLEAENKRLEADKDYIQLECDARHLRVVKLGNKIEKLEAENKKLKELVKRAVPYLDHECKTIEKNKKALCSKTYSDYKQWIKDAQGSLE